MVDLKEKHRYELNCGCIMRCMDQNFPSGKPMYKREGMRDMYRGRFESTCDGHKGHKTSWHLWRRDGTWYFKRHGETLAEVRREFNVARRVD